MAEETMSRTLLSLVVLALASLCLLLALPPPVTSVDEENSTVSSGDGHDNASEPFHEEEEDKCMEEDESDLESVFDSTVRIARVEFHRVETIFIILVFIIVVVVAKMGKCSS